MATAEEITAFRLTIAESTDETYSDADLGARIDAATDLNSLAADIWLEKAGRYSRLVDMQEGTSRRSLSQLQDQALALAKVFREASGDSGGGSGSHRTTTRAIVRL